MSPTRSGSALLGPCGPMRGPCGARLTMARRRANGRARPSRPDASHGPACRCMGAHAISHTQEGRRHGHSGPCAAHARRGWRGPAAGQRERSSQPPGRLAWGPHAAPWLELPKASPHWLMHSAAAVQHNARTHSGPPSTGATITMDGGVADTFVVLLSTTRVHVWSRSGHVNTKRIRFDETSSNLLLQLRQPRA